MFQTQDFWRVVREWDEAGPGPRYTSNHGPKLDPAYEVQTPPAFGPARPARLQYVAVRGHPGYIRGFPRWIWILRYNGCCCCFFLLRTPPAASALGLVWPSGPVDVLLSSV